MKNILEMRLNFLTSQTIRRIKHQKEYNIYIYIYIYIFIYLIDLRF